MSVKTSLSDRYSSHLPFNFMSLLEEMQIYPVLFEKWTSVLCMWFFTVLHMFLGFRNPGFISKRPGRPGFLSVDWSLWSSLSHVRKFFFHISLKLGLSNDCVLGSSGSLHTENTDSSSVCSQSEYFLLWGLQKAFTLSYSKRLSFNGGGDLMEFTEKCEELETFPCNCSVFPEPWKCLAFTHPLARSSAVCRTTSVCFFGSY